MFAALQLSAVAVVVAAKLAVCCETWCTTGKVSTAEV